MIDNFEISEISEITEITEISDLAVSMCLGSGLDAG
jgi:hypothetical protein